MDKWRQMISAQGGDPDAALPVAREHHVVTATADGVLTADCMNSGSFAIDLTCVPSSVTMRI